MSIAQHSHDVDDSEAAKVPASQSSHDVDAVALLNWPAAQTVHVAPHSFGANEPAAHGAQAVFVLLPVLDVPLGQHLH